jgi:hypothetical protein
MHLSISKMCVVGLAISVSALCLLAVTSQAPTAEGVSISSAEDGLDKAVRLRAGKDAIDCGRVRSGEDSDTTDKCVANAHEQKKPFVARYDLRGIDSIVADGVAGNAEGEIYVFRYDSDPSGGSNVGESIEEETCREIQIIKGKRGRRIKCEK